MNRFVILSALLLVGVNVSRAQEPIVKDTLEFDKAVSMSPATLLEGKVSSVMVSETPGNPLGPFELDIRGLNSLHGHNQPVYIVDGTIMGAPIQRSVNPFWNYPGFVSADDLNPLTHINAYDIESIRVLKDASATAIYGSNGANGVIIINTRRHGFKENEVIWNSNVSGVGLTDGLMHNHHLSFSGTRNKSSYDIALSYGQFFDNALSKKQDQASLKVSYDNTAGKVIRFGFNSIFGIGNFSNGNSNVPDYDDDGRRYAATASVYVTLNFTRWLSWKNSGGLDFRTFDRYFWYGNGNAAGLSYNGLASVVSHNAYSANANSVLTFNRYFGQYHHLVADAGFEYQATKSRYNTMSGNDFFSHELRAKGLSSMNSAKWIREYETGRGHMAFYGRIEYDYKKTVGLDLSWRADNTARYDDGNFISYPAVSAFVDVRKAFFDDSKVFSALRLEGGWGKSGLEDAVPYAYAGDYSTGNIPSVSAGAEPYYDGLSRLYTTEWNVGGAAGFLSDRIVIGLKYYNRLTEDRFSVLCFGSVNARQYWSSAPRSEVFASRSVVANRGYEVDAVFVPISTRDWKWTLSGNAAFNSNQVKYLDYNDLWSSNANVGNVLGRSAESILAYDIGPEGYYIDKTRDGHITDADRICIAETVPDIYGGASTMLRFKWFTLDVLTDFAVGGYMIDYNRMASEGATLVTSRYIARSDWFKIARIGLKYDIPLDSRWLKGLEVNVSGHNLLYATTLPGGYEFGSTVLKKMVLLGVKLEF